MKIMGSNSPIRFITLITMLPKAALGSLNPIRQDLLRDVESIATIAKTVLDYDLFGNRQNQ